MRTMHIQDFAGAANQGFGLSIGEAEMQMTLVEVKPLTKHDFFGRTRDPFSLIFRSESQVVLPQRIYRLHHDGMGEIDVFLVPVARDTGGILYQAVFN